MEHVAFVIRVKEGQEEEYIRRHENVWPEVLAGMKRAGFHSMRIFKSGLDLFVYVEVEDYGKASRILDGDPDSRRWEEYMSPSFRPPPVRTTIPTIPTRTACRWCLTGRRTRERTSGLGDGRGRYPA